MTNISVTLLDKMGTDISTVNAARVSFAKKSEMVEVGTQTVVDDDGVRSEIPLMGLSKPDRKLVNWLAEHRHQSPFGHASLSFHVRAPVFVRAQLVKHRFLRMNEVSRRYVDFPPEYFSPDTWRGRAKDKKQGSEGEIALSGKTKMSLVKAREWADKVYNDLLAEGVCPEQARMVLPQSMFTEWIWSGSMDAFSDMCNLRCKPDAQYETRLVADEIDDIADSLFPVSWAALRKESSAHKGNN